MTDDDILKEYISIYYDDISGNKYDELEEFIKNSYGFARYLLAKRIKLLGTAIYDSIFKKRD